MLKFLRQIRRKLVREKQVKNYLMYASGEILLVMIGILLALQINTWNEQRQQRIEEKRFSKSKVGKDSGALPVHYWNRLSKTRPTSYATFSE
jgi:hypothetical protein